MRKASQNGSKCLVEASAEVQQCEATQEPSEDVVVAEATVTTSPDVSPVSERASKLLVKKAERKARKAQRQETQEQILLEVAIPAGNAEKSDSETNLSQTASTPSMVSTASMVSGAETSESDALPNFPDLHDCGTPDSTTNQHIDVSDASEQIPFPEEHNELREVQACVVSGGHSISEASYQADESEHPQESACHSDPGENITLTSDAARINFDDIESDSESDVECINHPANVAPMLDTTQSCDEIQNAPIMWCNPSMMTDSSSIPMQIEGWMPVAVPADCAPPGAFDGLWKNDAGEKILIEGLEIMFESGVAWEMEMHSCSSMSVKLNGEPVYGELDSSGEQLLWTDGDVWTFFGRAQTDSSPEAVPEVPCVMMPVMTQPDEVAMPSMMPVMLPEEMICMPANGEKWETCWDWAKKGWCPRGMNCEWYHPAPEAAFFSE